MYPYRPFITQNKNTPTNDDIFISDIGLSPPRSPKYQSENKVETQYVTGRVYTVLYKSEQDTPVKTSKVLTNGLVT